MCVVTSALHMYAVCCSVLQCVAVCCSVLQCVAVSWRAHCCGVCLCDMSHSCVARDSFTCGKSLCVWDMTYSRVWHDAWCSWHDSLCTCGMTLSSESCHTYEWNTALVCVPWHAQIYFERVVCLFVCETWLMTYSCLWHNCRYMWHYCLCVCDMTPTSESRRTYEWYDAFVCMCAMTRSNLFYNSFNLFYNSFNLSYKDMCIHFTRVTQHFAVVFFFDMIFFRHYSCVSWAVCVRSPLMRASIDSFCASDMALFMCVTWLF